MIVRRYNSADHLEEWNSFVAKSRNSTFLFDRRFMDYHADRFEDHSLMVYEEGKLVAVIPANKSGEDHISSHQGLTYGGIVVGQEAKLSLYIDLFYYVLAFLEEQGIRTFRLKQFPAFYNVHPTDETEYVLFLLDAKLYRRDIAYVIDQDHKIAYTGNIRREGNKAEKLAIVLKEDDELDGFWNEVLSPNLKSRFNVSPVHSLEEIKRLKAHFPGNVKQYNVYLDGTLVAGTTMFVTPQVAHCQYISASDHGRKTGCLNYLFKTLIDTTFQSTRFFDFGIVNENEGRSVNAGMLFWKESFGGRAQKHDFYEIATGSFKNLESFRTKN